MWNGNDGPDGWVWVLMVFMMALFWVPVLFAIFWFVRRSGQPAVQGGDRNGAARGDAEQLDAREIARRAYARGEHSREQFHEIMADLEQAAGGARDEDNSGT